MSQKDQVSHPSGPTEVKSDYEQIGRSEMDLYPYVPPPIYGNSQGNQWILYSIGFGLLAVIILLVSAWYFFFSHAQEEPVEADPAAFVVPRSPTPSITPSLTVTPTPTATGGDGGGAKAFVFLEPTPVPTSVPGGQVLILRPDRQDSGWVVSDDESIATIYDAQNHFGDSFLYAGILDGKVYHAAIQFDLGDVPRGTKVLGASLRLTGLREDLLNIEGDGSWRLQLLAPELDYYWNTVNFEQLQKAEILASIGSPLTQTELATGLINDFEFAPEQLVFLERRILAGSDESGAKVSFRLDGPLDGASNLFAWDTGYGTASQEALPELFINLGPPPEQTPPPKYVFITSTPTPENILTAAANSVQMTAEATRVGTATPLPPNWVTPVVVTSTPGPNNPATAQFLSQQATAAALTTGEPFNVVTATPTPTYMIITSTPTPPNIATALANSVQMTAEATRAGTATPLPPNWVTPFVVTDTPTPENEATVQYRQAVILSTGTATPLPDNVQTATPTPTYMIITSTPTPPNIATALANSVQMTAEATRGGTATPLPPNWVTPVVVTVTPTPVSSATAEYLQAVILTTGTPTPTPANMQTATATPVFIAIEPLVTPTPTPTPSLTPQAIPASLVGKVIFLSDREGGTVESPQAYVYDPETGQLGRLTALWPYEMASIRDAWSADKVYETYTQKLLWTNIEDSLGNRTATEVLAIHYYDHIYKVERMVTKMGVGIVYDPAWSPVGEEIAFVATESGNDEIWVINRDGSGIRQLTRNEWEWDKHPSWSPDGQQIVFSSNRLGNNQLWIMNKDGSEQHLLMDWNPYNDWGPVWVKYPDSPPPLPREPDWRFRKEPTPSPNNR